MIKNVTVLGMGYVGFPLACVIALSKQYNVTGIDLDEEKVRKINAGIPSVDDEIAEEDFAQVQFPATTSFEGLSEADCAIICVPTPVSQDKIPNLGPVISASASIAKHGKKGMYVIIESTINPGVCEEVVVPVFAEYGWEVNKDYYLAHCPERINPGDPKWNVHNIPRVLGSSTQESAETLAAFYRSFLDAEVKVMKDIRHAEATKIIENTFRDINIAYVNELAKSFDKLGLDIKEVIEGASTKPFAFLPHYPSCGVGGHCIPVDPYYLIERAKKQGFDHKFLSLAREINNSMPEYTIEKLWKALNKHGQSLQGSKVGLLGMSYKANVADLRESPALELQKILLEYGVNLDVYEPYDSAVSTVSSLEVCLQNNDVIVIATNHTVFVEEMSPELCKKNGISIVVDGKNCLDKNLFTLAGIEYIGVGR